MSVLLIIGFLVSAGFQKITVSNTSAPDGYGRYNWKVFVVGSQATLDKIEYVEYTLHPTFPDNVRISRNREDNFSLQSNGWGEFFIYLRIHLKNGKDLYTKYWLRLGNSG
jgi:transcription initiation factor IIF auxiliary subunit